MYTDVQTQCQSTLHRLQYSVTQLLYALGNRKISVTSFIAVFTLLWWSRMPCPTLCNPMDRSLPRSSVHGIFQARVLSGLPFPYPRISHNYTYIMGRRRGKQRMRRLDGIINPMNMTEQTPGDSEGQRCLVCCHPWGHKESDTNETLNNNVHISTPS